MKKNNEHKKIKILIKTFTCILSVLIIVGVLHIFKKFGLDPDAWVEYLRSFGLFSGLVLLLFQIIQVFVAVVPGEIIEIVAGLVYSPIIASIICYSGIFFASGLIFFLMRKLGKSFSRLLVSEEKLKSLRFINTKKRLKNTAFLLFLIPGTPKDLFIYFFALTPIKFSDFFILTSFARFPSIFSSVIGGKFVGDGEYLKAILVFAITALFSILGLIIYETTKNKLNNRKNKKFELRNQKLSIIFRKFKSKNQIKKVKSFFISKKISKINLSKKKYKFKSQKIFTIPKSISETH